MQKWWNWLIALAVICLLLIAIPISFNGKSKQQLMRPIFDEYIKKFNKTYKDNIPEYETRLKYFMDSMEEIDRLNAESRGPEEHKARYGPTRLSDMSKLEYKELHLSDEKMTRHPSKYGKPWQKHQHTDHHHSKDGGTTINNNIYVMINSRKKRAIPGLPLQVDWRSKGVIGGIRDQGMCGACWAFSTVGVMEAMAAMQTGKVEPLSVQETTLNVPQGMCGACWAFSTVGVMEAMAAMQTGKVEPLSVQETTLNVPQGMCGACWAFSTVGVMEAMAYSTKERASKLTHWNGISTRLVAFSTVGVMEAMAAMQTGKVEPLSVQETTLNVPQGMCGACWAFSTVGVMEAMAAMQTGKVEPLSVQES
ncbi:papain family cysteine protease domain-containing protein [Phthorimaea operculella]|nr:papain family cysteine protease domain-containing protein [Phthorimaea operculella]